jgi:hypothetical protein
MTMHVVAHRHGYPRWTSLRRLFLLIVLALLPAVPAQAVVFSFATGAVTHALGNVCGASFSLDGAALSQPVDLAPGIPTTIAQPLGASGGENCLLSDEIVISFFSIDSTVDGVASSTDFRATLTSVSSDCIGIPLIFSCATDFALALVPGTPFDAAGVIETFVLPGVGTVTARIVGDSATFQDFGFEQFVSLSIEYQLIFTPFAEAVPEPGTLALLVMSIVLAAATRRRSARGFPGWGVD